MKENPADLLLHLSGFQRKIHAATVQGIERSRNEYAYIFMCGT
jgi:hypothetical protein